MTEKQQLPIIAALKRFYSSANVTQWNIDEASVMDSIEHLQTVKNLLADSVDIEMIKAKLASAANETIFEQKYNELKDAVIVEFNLTQVQIVKLEAWIQAALSKFVKSLPNQELIGPNQLTFRRLYVALLAKLIVAHNEKHPECQLGVNPLSFFNAEELKGTSCGTLKFKPDEETSAIMLQQGATPTSAPISYPANWNLQTLNAVGPVLNQGNCGGCYSFSAAEALAGAYASLNQGNYQALSEQQIISCSTAKSGCNGGTFQAVFNYANSVGGLTTNAVYPYASSNGKAPTCNTQLAADGAVMPQPASKFSSYVSVTTDAQMQAAAYVQPVSIAIQASSSCFQNYKSGVLTPSNCDCGDDVDHAVLLTGWGVTSQGQEYWIVKNSWGSSWGNGGFVWIARLPESQNYCGMYTQSAYPTKTSLSPDCQVNPTPSYCIPYTTYSANSQTQTASPTPSSATSMQNSWMMILVLIIAHLL